VKQENPQEAIIKVVAPFNIRWS